MKHEKEIEEQVQVRHKSPRYFSRTRRFSCRTRGIPDRIRPRLSVKEHGGIALKFTSPGFDGMPDRLILLPNGKMAFAELKSLGKNLICPCCLCYPQRCNYKHFMHLKAV